MPAQNNAQYKSAWSPPLLLCVYNHTYTTNLQSWRDPLLPANRPFLKWRYSWMWKWLCTLPLSSQLLIWRSLLVKRQNVFKDQNLWIAFDTKTWMTEHIQTISGLNAPSFTKLNWTKPEHSITWVLLFNGNCKNTEKYILLCQKYSLTGLD